MNAHMKQVIEQALALSPEEREEIIERLSESLESPVEGDVEAAWADELRRRMDEVERGEVEMIPWSDVRRELMDIIDRADEN